MARISDLPEKHQEPFRDYLKATLAQVPALGEYYPQDYQLWLLKIRSDTDKCPNCEQHTLVSGDHYSGQKCTNPDCNYWFCY